MEKVILNAETREELGKSKVKKIRHEDMIPAVVYKGSKESLNIKVKRRELFDVLHTKAGENVLITLKVKGDAKKKERLCIIKEVQADPVQDEVIHVDLNEISLTDKIKVKVRVYEHGEAEGVVKDGGVLEHALWEVDVECLPADIPEKIVVEVSHLKIGDAICIRDLKVASGVTVLNNPDLTVLNVVPPAKEEVVEVAPAEGIEEPEVIAKGKKEEEEIEEEGAAKKEAPKKEGTPTPAKEGGEKKKE